MAPDDQEANIRNGVPSTTWTTTLAWRTLFGKVGHNFEHHHSGINYVWPPDKLAKIGPSCPSAMTCTSRPACSNKRVGPMPLATGHPPVL